ncbi:MAG: hypothetical protein ABI566_04535 [Pseudolysinimonas sp.]
MTDQATINALRDLASESKKQTALLEKILSALDGVERAVYDSAPN